MRSGSQIIKPKTLRDVVPDDFGVLRGPELFESSDRDVGVVFNHDGFVGRAGRSVAVQLDSRGAV
jgi:hypothetical protein